MTALDQLHELAVRLEQVRNEGATPEDLADFFEAHRDELPPTLVVEPEMLEALRRGDATIAHSLVSSWQSMFEYHEKVKPADLWAFVDRFEDPTAQVRRAVAAIVSYLTGPRCVPVPDGWADALRNQSEVDEAIRDLHRQHPKLGIGRDQRRGYRAGRHDASPRYVQDRLGPVDPMGRVGDVVDQAGQRRAAGE